jgi:uncharacterized protein (DUF1778 family)
VTQGALIKFRLTASEKQQIADAARRAETSVSALVRRAARDAAAGRLADRNLLADLVLIRRTANSLASIADSTAGLPAELIGQVRAAATDLRRIAARHLEVPM